MAPIAQGSADRSGAYRPTRGKGRLPMTDVSGFARGGESRAFLRDGRSVLVRPARGDDEPLLYEFSRRLSRQTLAQRLLGPVPRFRRELLRQFVDVDGFEQLALVAIHDDAIIATARLLRIDGSDHADVTFTIEDDFQGQGLGPVLLDALAAAGRRVGISVFEADVLSSNSMMLAVFQRSGYPVSLQAEGHLQHVVLKIDPRGGPPGRLARRHQQSVRRSLEPLMQPRSIAVIGANRAEHTIGHKIVRNLLDHGFAGPIHPINPNADEVAGLPAYSTVGELRGPPDLAVIAVRPAALVGAVADCATAGVLAIVVVTADLDEETLRALPELLSFVRSHSIRLVGPTSMGLLSMTDHGVADATFAPIHPRPGGVAMASRSGPLGLALLEVANRTGMGFRAFVSTGDALDVGAIDLLEWWEDDPGATTVLLQAEQFGTPREFVRIARRVSARKPIVAVTSGDDATAALLGQAGVIHAATFDDMFDTALVLAHQPVPRGRCVAIVSNARDPAELAARAGAAHGLELAASTPGFAGGIRDLGHAASAEDYRRALADAIGDPDVHAVLAVFLPPLVLHAAEVAAAIVAAASGAGETTLVASYMSAAGIPEPLRGASSAVPSFTFPERAMAALGRAAAYGAWRREAAGVVSYPSDMRRSEARRLLTRSGSGPLTNDDVSALLECYGIRVAAPGVAASSAPAAVLHMHLDPLVGPVLNLGLEGPPSEVFGDIALGVTPLTDQDAHRLVASLRALPLLTGSATAPARDVAALEDAVLRLSALVDDHERIVQLRIPRLEIGREGEGVLARSPTINLAPLPSDDVNR